MFEPKLKPHAAQPSVTDTVDITFGNGWLSIEDVCAIALSNAPVKLTSAPEFWNKIDAGVAFLDQLLRDDGAIYGVTTGYGDSCTVKVPLDQVWELPIHLSRFHGCRLGDDF